MTAKDSLNGGKKCNKTFTESINLSLLFKVKKNYYLFLPKNLKIHRLNSFGAALIKRLKKESNLNLDSKSQQFLHEIFNNEKA
jgi:hypothetical protein